ncbi:IS21 family transposase [Croceicoccus sp. Ery5]|jgi:transposase|uniref:IS21 family transposase n=1 Tax=Croceicoccus sp. Ery5 TaxID=1703340 RepID=UPI001E60158B|nr:IS21 family transposase [Croceicoccus sp. Ery5]
MKNYRAMLRQLVRGKLSCNAIAVQRNMSHHTVRRASRIIEQQRITADQIDNLGDAELEALFYPARRPAKRFVEPDWSKDHNLIRTGFTRLEMHERYVQNAGNGRTMSYREYCRRFAIYLRALDPVMRIDHAPGYALQTDYAGYTPKACDHGSISPVSFKLFVATLPFSRLVYAVIARSEKTNDHIDANIAAIQNIGGSPLVLVPDNLKAAVLSRPRFGPPRINAEYQSFADHYGIGISPARPNHPQDKSAVENSVKLVQRALRLRFHNRPVPSLTELRLTLSDIVEKINEKPLRRANGHSRRSLFEAEERAHLQPLPPEPYLPIETRAEALVGRDYHVIFRGCYYSVPHIYTGETVSLTVESQTVHISLKSKSIATHPRLHGTGRTSTLPEHRPQHHRLAATEDILEWAETYAEAVRTLAAADISSPLPAHLRKQRTEWIKSLPRRFTRRRFEMACQRAVDLGDLRFKHVENALIRGIETTLPQQIDGTGIVARSNVRGADYYGKKGSSL